MNDIEKVVRILEFADTGYPAAHRTPIKRVILLTTAAAASLILALTLWRPADTTLIDTFESPELAYVKTEQIFSRISGSIDKCMTRTENVYHKINTKNE